MKTIKSMLIATILIGASVVSTMSAQQADAPAYQWKVAVGDSVKINPECTKYLTGETPSTWVYDKVHTVGQLGTKRFPEGVLLFKINSWICEECLVPVNATEQKQEEVKPVAEPQPVQQPAPQPVAAEPVAEPTPAEPTPAPVAEPAPASEPEPVELTPEQKRAAAERAAIQAADSALRANEEAAKQQQQAKQGDTIVSKQNFKHNYDRFTIGVRGGAAGLLHKVQTGKWLCGGDVLLDLQYAHYWANDARPADLGIITGIALGYSQSGMKAAVDSKMKVLDDADPSFPMTIDYTVKADEVKEADGQLQLEIPLLFSMIHDNGVFFNFGPKFMLPLYTPYTQTISNNANTYISAYFEQIEVQVKNEVITGVLAQDQYMQKGTDNGNQFSINIILTAELGYEWILKSGNSFGLGAYANYGVYNSFKNNASTTPLISVTPPQGENAAIVNVLSATKTYATGLGYFDAGLKLAYHFNFPKKQQVHYQMNKLR